MKDPFYPPGDARSVRPGEPIDYRGDVKSPLLGDGKAVPVTFSDEADIHIAKMNQLAAELESEVARGTQIWNRTARGSMPLTAEQIHGVRAALARVRKAVE